MKRRKKAIAFILSLCRMVSMLGYTIMAGEIGHLVISQIYGGGGNNRAPYLNDFIELYNPTEQDILLDGYSVQYASATGKFGSNITPLQGIIKAKGYYLIKEASGSGKGVELPTADAEGNINLSGTKGKVALVKKQRLFQKRQIQQ